jgi:hypothetical protein
MKFLPIENITLKTHLNEEEIIRRLSDHIEPVKIFRSGFFYIKSKKPYEGKIIGKSFKIRKITNVNVLFDLLLIGDIDGSTISLRMRMSIKSIISHCLSLGLVGAPFIVILIKTFSDSEFIPLVLFFFGMLLGVYLLIIAGFNVAKKILLKDLQEFLKQK